MFAVGSQIGKYTLRRKLGQGGFGAVFAGFDPSLEREVAIKILNAEHETDDEVMRRFLQEARVAARVGHPGITTIFECAQLEDRTAYIAMELLDGESLAHRLHRSGRLAPVTALEIARQIASALEAAHAAGIVHRDLKPDNIFLVKDPAMPGGERVKVLDFGIAKLHDAQTTEHTQTSAVFGTPKYMSPEQCRSSTQIDGRSDIYTLGCILFELVTGRPPFVGQTGELFAQHLMVDAPNVLSLVRETPYHVAELVQQMLAKDVAARPQSMADVQRRLEAGGAVVAGVPVTLPSVSSVMPRVSTLTGAASEVAMPSSRAPRMAIAFATAATIALAIVIVLLMRDSGQQTKRIAAAAPPPPPAEPAKPSVVPIEEPVKEPIGEPIATQAVSAAPTEPTPKPRKAKREPNAIPPKPEQGGAPAPEPTKPVAPAPERPAVVDARKGASVINPFAEQGTLVLRSTPACEILIDGKAIAARTPHELSLAPGKHRVTLVNDEHDIKETFVVQIEQGGTQRVNRDLTEKVKANKRNATINPFGGGS